MANSKYEYVRSFERDEILLPNTWIVVRIDGRGFHKLSKQYNFTKPNDKRALDLMNAAAQGVIKSLPDLCFGYGVSDEFSFVFEKLTNLFERRAAKLISTVVSTFTAHYMHFWDEFFLDTRLESPWLPTFDGRVVCYPNIGNLRDYLSWRQVDCHINNLYNTTFWMMVIKGGMSATAAEDALKGTVASDKNEILFSRFGVNYNNEAEIYRKGSVIYRDYQHQTLEDSSSLAEITANDEQKSTDQPISRTQAEKARKAKIKAKIAIVHTDIIKDDFWTKRPWILSGVSRKRSDQGNISGQPETEM